MIPTLLRVSWTNLKRDRVAQVADVPAADHLLLDLRDRVRQPGTQLDVFDPGRVVDQDGRELSRRIVEGLKQEKSLRVRTTAEADGKGAALDTPAAENLVRRGDVPVAVVLPEGLGETAAAFGPVRQSVPIKLLADVSIPSHRRWSTACCRRCR
jgi:hypothetical protein